MKIDLLEIAGFQPAFKAMRLPMRSGEKSDSRWYDYIEDREDIMFRLEENIKDGIYPLWHTDDGYNVYIVGKKDLKLAQSLILAGDDHSKFVRGIQAWIEVTGPDYWWDEVCTYEVGVTKLPSTSSMHVDFKGLVGKELAKYRSNQTRGFEYTRVYVWSYQALRHVYFARRHHRLPEWKEFTDFIETLPLAEELITIKKEI